MIICSECGHQEMAGALFCTECGEHLLELGGMPAVNDQISILKAPDLIGNQETKVIGSGQVMLMVPSSGRRVSFSLGETIRVGRADQGDPNEPGLNLAIDGGSSAGVSRNHAEIRLSDDGMSLILIDLNSTNGTFLNHFRLPAELPYPINHGDEIYFGNLVVHVFIKSSNT